MTADTPRHSWQAGSGGRPAELSVSASPSGVEGSAEPRRRPPHSGIAAGCAIVLLLAACGTTLSPKTPGTPSATSAPASPSTSASVTPSSAPSTPTPNSTGDVTIGTRTWFGAPVPINSAIPLFPSDDMTSGTFTFYQVGSLSDGEAIDLGLISEMQVASFLFLDSGSHYTILEAYSPDIFGQGGQVMFSDGVGPNTSVDATITYPELDPTTLSVGGVTYTNVSEASFLSPYDVGEGTTLTVGTTDGTDTNVVASTEYGDLYSQTSSSGMAPGQLTETSFVLAGYDFIPQIFLPAPAIYSISAGDLTFTATGAASGYPYTDAGAGCSVVDGDEMVLSEPASYTFAPVATTADGTVLSTATLPDGTPAFVPSLYSLYSSLDPTPLVPYATYLASDPILFYTDSQGNEVGLLSTEYPLSGGCGKPVEYLYPAHAETVHVAVGADVVTSDPAYDGGWTVQASPSGRIEDNGATYGSLYWEGYALNAFPAITEGTVVPRGDAAAVLSSQSRTLGLDPAEASAFLAFWVPRIPTAPYIEISWLTTPTLDQLLPLTVTPRPTTMLRIFVVMQGDATDVSVPAEPLHGTVRRGFTLVEWGGLLATSVP